MFKQNYKDIFMNIKRSLAAVHVWSYQSTVWCQWCQIQMNQAATFLRSESNETFSNNEQKLAWGWINDRISNFPTQAPFPFLYRWIEPVTSLFALVSSSLVLLDSHRLSFTSGPLKQLSTHSRLTDLTVLENLFCGHEHYMWASQTTSLKHRQVRVFRLTQRPLRPHICTAKIQTITFFLFTYYPFCEKKCLRNPNHCYIKNSIERILFQTVSRGLWMCASLHAVYGNFIHNPLHSGSFNSSFSTFSCRQVTRSVMLMLPQQTLKG